MAYISFIAFLIGAAGIAGSMDMGSMAGIMAAAVIHIGGIVGMAAAGRKEEEETDEDKEYSGVSPVDKLYGTSAGGHSADH